MNLIAKKQEEENKKQQEEYEGMRSGMNASKMMNNIQQPIQAPKISAPTFNMPKVNIPKI